MRIHKYTCAEKQTRSTSRRSILERTSERTHTTKEKRAEDARKTNCDKSAPAILVCAAR